MKQIIQSARSGDLKVKDVPTPRAGQGEILVHTQASLISAGTERMLVKFAKKNLIGKAKSRPDLVKKILNKAKTDGIGSTINSVLSRLDNPIPLGYSAAGKVISVGSELEGSFKVGDRVAICGAGIANHSEINVVPANLAVHIPEGVTDDEAAFGTVGAIALHSVRNLDAKLGEVVTILGAGIIGQLAAQLLNLSGVRVILIDSNQKRLNIARRLGALKCYNLADENIENNIMAATRGIGCDGILIAAATESNNPFIIASNIARDRARVCLVGMSGTKFPYAEFMKKEMSIIVSRSYGPGRYDEDYETRGMKYPEGFIRWTETENLNEIMRLLSLPTKNKLDVNSLVTHCFDIENAEFAYKTVLDKTVPQLGIILHYGKKIKKRPKNISISTRNPKRCVLGMIGAGNFARTVLIPELIKLHDVSLRTIVTKTGASATFAKENFGFEVADTDEERILKDKKINAVLIATRHDSHAELTARALTAGKSVLVEKPLGLNEKELNIIRKARKNSVQFFQVGFNRRFAPTVKEAHSFLNKIEGPRFMVFRINAGKIARDNWLYKRNEGGGRIIGEMCHFVDLARHFANARIKSLQADTGSGMTQTLDDVTATIQFANGSLATIAYTSLGDESFPKERIEIFSGNTVIAIDNLKDLSITSNNTTKIYSHINQDKGFKAALIAFTQAVASGGSAPIDENELLETSSGTFAILESLKTGLKITI